MSVYEKIVKNYMRGLVSYSIMIDGLRDEVTNDNNWDTQDALDIINNYDNNDLLNMDGSHVSLIDLAHMLDGSYYE